MAGDRVEVDPQRGHVERQLRRRLGAVGEDVAKPYVRKAIDWLKRVQNEDGGWGESCNTYDDPVHKGSGPSTASQTAWAVMGLCALGDPDLPALKRGIDYLV